jgi:hypothetical protein
LDEPEQRWKALQNYEMLRARKYVEAVYYHELIRDLRKCGYRIRHQSRGDFQIEGVDDSICRRFSKRHEQINEALDALLREKPELAGANLKDLRERLATAERSRKLREQNTDELRHWWHAQLTPDELKSIQRLTRGKVETTAAINPTAIAKEAIAWAEEHLFDRQSVVLEHTIWQEAIQHVHRHDIYGGFAIRRGDVDQGKMSIIGGAIIAAAPAAVYAFYKIFGIDSNSAVGVGNF